MSKYVNSRISKSVIFISFLVSFLFGIFFSDLVRIELSWLIGILLGLVIALVFLRSDFGKNRLSLLIILVLGGFILGLGYYRFWDNRQQNNNIVFGENTEVTSQIYYHPDIFPNQARYILKYNDRKIQIVTGRFPEYKYGDVLKISGTVKPSNDYLKHQNIVGVIYNPEKIEKVGSAGNIMYKTMYNIRDSFENSLNKVLSEPYASFAAGLLLGSKRNIPDSLMADFNRTGTTHIIAVSGYNVTIIIINLGILFGLLSHKLKFWGSLIVIIGFVILTGAAASVVRAGIFTGLVALGKYEGRRINMTILLMLTAFTMLFFNPYGLKFDISFQLSFLAFAGLVYLSPIISNNKIIKIFPKFFKSTFSDTMSAQIFVLPILIFYFGRASIVSPIVNILILWIIPATMLVVFLAGLGGLIWLAIGNVIGYIAWLFLKYIIIVVETFSKIPWASYEIKINSWWWMPVYFLVLGTLIYRNRALVTQDQDKA